MLISDWSSDVCSSDLALFRFFTLIFIPNEFITTTFSLIAVATLITGALGSIIKRDMRRMFSYLIVCHIGFMIAGLGLFTEVALAGALFYLRSEEHTSELQSLMRISYAVFCLKKKKN